MNVAVEVCCACSPLLLFFLTGSPLARSSVVTAVKFTVVDQPAPIDSLLKGCIGETQTSTWRLVFSVSLTGLSKHYPIQPLGGDTHCQLYFPDEDLVVRLSCLSGDFLKMLQDEDMNVRRAALVMFNSAAHNKPSLIRGLLATVLPYLYKETQLRKELIREVSF